MDCGPVQTNEKRCLECIHKIEPRGRLYNCTARQEKTFCGGPKPTPTAPGAEFCCGTTGAEKCDGDLTELVMKFNANMTTVSIRSVIDGDSTYCADEAVALEKVSRPGEAHPVSFPDINATTDCLNKLLAAQGASPSDLTVTYADDSRFRLLNVAIAGGPTVALKQCNLPHPPPSPSSPTAARVQTLAGGLTVEITQQPGASECEQKTEAGNSLSMHYTGTLAETGTKFDSSRDRNQPFSFVLGQHQVIAGWDQGLLGAENVLFAPPFYAKNRTHLPRQARDKRRKS